MKKKMR